MSDVARAWNPAFPSPMSVRVPVGDVSRVGEARRAADLLAGRCGLDEHARGVLGIVVTEAAMNLARHARDGSILLRELGEATAGVEMLAIDRGPGMRDLAQFFADGYSTGGTSGAGLGAMKRQADELDVYSMPGQGTVVLARVFATGAVDAAPRRLVDVGAVCLPIEGESVCGDGWGLMQDGDRARVVLVDGLGHGAHAAEAADVALGVFQRAGSLAPGETVTVMHDALRATRGAAVAVAEVRRAGTGGEASIVFCGVGNTVTTLVSATGRHSLTSMNGTAGLAVRGMREFTAPWHRGDVLVLHTDGITSRWRLEGYPGVLTHDPAIAAALLHRDFARGRDDATVLALTLDAAGAR